MTELLAALGLIAGVVGAHEIGELAIAALPNE